MKTSPSSPTLSSSSRLPQSSSSSSSSCDSLEGFWRGVLQSQDVHQSPDTGIAKDLTLQHHHLHGHDGLGDGVDGCADGNGDDGDDDDCGSKWQNQESG